MTSRLPGLFWTASRYRQAICFAICIGALIAWPQPVQSEIADAPNSTAVPPSPDVMANSQPAFSANQVVRGPDDPDYWIVSSRRVNDQIERGQPCDFDVLRFDGHQPCRSTNLDELLASLQPGVPVCFMAHGSFVTWNSMLADSAETYHWLRQAAPCRPVHIIFYTWASNDGELIPHFKIHKFGRRATLNGFYLADLVSRVSSRHPVCLIGHSHGTRMVSAAMHVMAGGEIDGKILGTGPLPPQHIRVVLAAAAIDHDWLNPGGRYERAICAAEAVVNLRNKHDFPLLFYPLRRPFSTHALAIAGVTAKDRKQLGREGQKIVDLDVTDQVGFGHVWGNYYDHPEIAAAIRHYVYFDESGY